MTQRSNLDEEITVLFHAALLGRTDVLSNAITAIRGKLPAGDVIELRRLISSTRPDDGSTALHIAAGCGHCDIVRALLVSHRY